MVTYLLGTEEPHVYDVLIKLPGSYWPLSELIFTYSPRLHTHWLQLLFASALCICFILSGRTRPWPCSLAVRRATYILIKWIALHHPLTFNKALKLISNFNVILADLSLPISCNKCQLWEAPKLKLLPAHSLSIRTGPDALAKLFR